jgi:hypothetical protein
MKHLSLITIILNVKIIFNKITIIVKDENLYEGDKIDAFNKDLQLNVGLSSKKIETEFLHNYLRIRIPVLAKAFRDNKPENDESNSCNYDTFKTIIKSMNIHNKYTSDDLLTFIFNKFKNNTNQMVFNDFIEKLHSNHTENDFYGLKDVK